MAKKAKSPEVASGLDTMLEVTVEADNTNYEALYAVLVPTVSEDGRTFFVSQVDDPDAPVKELSSKLPVRAAINAVRDIRLGFYEHLEEGLHTKCSLARLMAEEDHKDFAVVMPTFKGRWIEGDNFLDIAVPEVGTMGVASWFNGSVFVRAITPADVSKDVYDGKVISTWYKHTVMEFLVQGYSLKCQLGPDTTRILSTAWAIITEKDDAKALSLNGTNSFRYRETKRANTRVYSALKSGSVELEPDNVFFLRGGGTMSVGSIPAGAKLVRWSGEVSMGAIKWNPADEKNHAFSKARLADAIGAQYKIEVC